MTATGWVTADRLAALRSAATLAPDTDHETVAVESPGTGEVLGEVDRAMATDVEDAVERAREAQSRWADRPLADRADVLLDFHDRLLDERAAILDVLQAEAGKARTTAFEEILDVAIGARHYATNAERYLGTERRRGAVPLLTKTVVHRHPVGVVGLVSPWNYPLSLTAGDALPALLAGNAVVLKPDTATPYTALYVARLLREAGLPEDAFQVVVGAGGEVGEAVVEHADFVAFTGSTETGRTVAEQAGRHLTEVSLELGGKNPALVLPDADLERAAAGIAKGAFANAGQLCISPERVYVHEVVADAFRDAFVSRTRSLRLATDRSWATDVGTLSSADQLATVQAHLADAIEKGATVLSGGRHRPDVGPYAFEPTVLTNVTPEMALFAEETFGPVVALYEVSSVDEAVERANDSPYGLNASVWTGDTVRGERVAERVECGTVGVNDPYPAAWASIDAPMGGVKDSGVGRRHGREGVQKYTESQTVATQRLVGIQPDPIPGRLWAEGFTAVLRAWRRFSGWRR
ncbi:MAG: succinic semialdehyde dehydrogenase [Halanaeroarchaeum sp.]